MLPDHKKSLKRVFMGFVIPSVLAQWVYMLYTMVDGIFVARGVSEVALTAVNLSSPFVQALFAFSLMFAVGASTMIGILLGRRQPEQASEIFTQSVVVQLVLGVGITLLAFCFRVPIARFLGASDGEILDYVVEYLGWIAPFATAFLLSYSFEILLKTDGFPKLATAIVILGAIENCILDWLFVIVLKKGVAGAAFATGLSQTTVMALYLRHFLSGKGSLSFRRFAFSLPALARQVRNGLSSGLTEMSSGVVTFLFNRVIVAYLSQSALVSYTIVSYVNSIVVLSATGIAQGSQPLISYYYGRRDADCCKKLLKYCLVTAIAFCTAAFVLCFFLAPQVVGLYVRPELAELRTASVQVFRTFILALPLVGLNIAVSGYFISVERAVSSLIISAGRGGVLVLGSLLLLANLFGGEAIWYAPLLSEAACLAVTTLLFLSYARKDPLWWGEDSSH